MKGPDLEVLKKVSLPGMKMFKGGERGADFLAVDLSSNFVKIVHAVKDPGTDEMIVQHVAEKEFDENADSAVSQFLAETVQKFGVTTKEVICTVPSKLFMSKNVDMPSSDHDEISKIVDLQAGRYTPYSRDEIVIDYLCMETTGQHYTNVILVIVNRKVIDRYYQIVEKAGMFVERILIASEGMALWYDQITDLQSETDAIAGIHISEDCSDFTIIDRHQMVFVRSIPVGAKQLKQDRATAQVEFFNELNKSIAAYQDQGLGRPVRILILTGIIEGLEFLEESISSSVPVVQANNAAVKMIPYAGLFRFSDEASQEVAAQASQGSFYEVLSALTTSPELKIDLIPKEVKLKRRVREGGKDVITLGILIMTCLGMACVFLASKIYLRTELIKKIEHFSESSAEESQLLEHASTKSRLVRNLLKNRGKGLSVFERVTSLVNEEIYLNSFSYDSEGNLLISGTANSMSRVYAFVTELEESNYFSSVKTKQTKSRKVGQADVADFDLECTLAESSGPSS